MWCVKFFALQMMHVIIAARFKQIKWVPARLSHCECQMAQARFARTKKQQKVGGETNYAVALASQAPTAPQQ